MSVDLEAVMTVLRNMSVNSDPPAPSSESDFEDRGFCYLKLFRVDIRPRVATVLGANPYMTSIVGYMEVHRTELSDAHFGLTLGAKVVNKSGVYFQAHLVEAFAGFRAVDFINFCMPQVRVGSEVVSMGAAAGSVSSIPTVAGATVRPAFVREVRLHRVLTRPGETFVVDFDEHDPIPQLTSLFESVQLLGVRVSASLVGGAMSILHVSVSGNDTPPDLEDDWMACPYYLSLLGDTQTGTDIDFVLPDNHPFSKELKVTAAGNPSPKFWFCLESKNTAKARVRVTLVLGFAGVGLTDSVLVPLFVPTA